MLRVVAIVAVAVLAFTPPVSASAQNYGHSAIVQRGDDSIFEVDGKPFFVYGAAFFYERLPRDQWAASLRNLQQLGINTLDLYVPWNWHEPSDGNFDFDGRTSPRRDLHEVMRLARADGFKIILRPGPVIRNEWRNGGYPAWLLARPEYGMPLHDRLEGRYPPTATLQNAHSDDAAAQWMRNATHMRYARRWLERVLREFAPDADLVIAVALDDDQGAYLDNQTYPAPHFQAYIRWLRDVVHGVTGPREPVFINTYQMKVTASSPVWAMGNWYQSDAYALGEHDLAQLQLSFGMLQTQPRQPLMSSEFQAGWLEQPDDIRPRAADPSNTSLAFATMLGMGVRGVVNFPAQDTLYPAGWEVPFANAFYAWDAALGLSGKKASRFAGTAELGALIALLGPQLAASHVEYDAAIAYLGDAYAPSRLQNEQFAEIAARTMDAQRLCRDAGLNCRLIDARAADDRELRRFPFLLVPRPRFATAIPLGAAVTARLVRYERAGGRILAVTNRATLLRAFASAGRQPIVTGLAGASFATDPSGVVARAVITIPSGRRIVLPPFVVPAHRALIVPIDLRLARIASDFSPSDRLLFDSCMPVSMTASRAALQLTFLADTAGSAGPRIASDVAACTLAYRIGHVQRRIRAGPSVVSSVRLEARGRMVSVGILAARSMLPATLAAFLPVRTPDAQLPEPSSIRSTSRRARAYRADLYRDGEAAVVLDNGVVRVVVAPAAGARAFVFQDDATQRNVFTTVGAMRDDVAVEPPLSTTDRIARYTHAFPAGTFNRTYAARIVQSGSSARARFRYHAPDVVPHGVTYDRTVALQTGAREFTLDERVTIPDVQHVPRQRGVSVTSLSVGNGTNMATRRILAHDAASFSALTMHDVTKGHALGYYDTVTHELATLAWDSHSVERVQILERAYSIVARMTLANGRTAHIRFGYESAPSLRAAQAMLSTADAAAQR